MLDEVLLRKSRSPRVARFVFVLGSVIVGGLLLAATPVVASNEAPEEPITEGCSGPLPGGGQELCGTLNPHSSAKAGAYFAYNIGSSCTGGKVAPATDEVEKEDFPVSAIVSGLQGGTTYKYCLVATNPAGKTIGQTITFTTPGVPAPEEPITEVCSGPPPGSGQKLCGTLNPHTSARAGAYFAYDIGPSCTGAGESRAPASGEVEGQDIAVAATATGLQAGAEYAYCLVAINASGKAVGQTMTFHTPPAKSSEQSETPIGHSCSESCVLPSLGLLLDVKGDGSGGSISLGSHLGLTPKPLTRAQKLAKALRTCHRKPRRLRASCERAAHKRYGARSATRGKRK